MWPLDAPTIAVGVEIVSAVGQTEHPELEKVVLVVSVHLVAGFPTNWRAAVGHLPHLPQH